MGNTAKLKYYWPQSCYELKTNKLRGRAPPRPAIVSRRPLRQRRSGSMRLGTAYYCCRSAAAARGVWRGVEVAAKQAKLPRTATKRMGYSPGKQLETGGSYTYTFPDGNASIARLLVRDGYEPVLAGDLSEAISVLQDAPVGGAVIDFLMPDNTGDVALRILQTYQPNLPAVLVSGYSGPRDENVTRGFAAVVLKPFSQDDFQKTILT